VSPLVYLDHMASTPLDPRVLEAMRPWLDPAAAGNPHATTHSAGWRARDAIEQARALVAELIGARPGEIVFTSGATEANNLALVGASHAGRRVVVSAIEHPSVLDCLPALEGRGRRTGTLAVDGEGRLCTERLDALGEDDLVSVTAASNEVGTLQPLAEIGELCRRRGARLHSDAVQALATEVVDVRAQRLDLLSLSGHKLYGPCGIGALFVRDGLAVTPLLFGGGQQGGMRPGTLPTALCVGLGEACRIARVERERDRARLLVLRERLWAGLSAAVPGARRNGSPGHGLAGCLNVTFSGVDAADLLLDLPELALATGSACASGRSGPSHVLLALGRSPREAHGSIRFGLGRGTTAADVELALDRLTDRLAARSRRPRPPASSTGSAKTRPPHPG
jgi:cysteine desulfurase